MKKLQELNLEGKRVLIRVDMNVPIKDGKVAEDTRIRASVASIDMAFEKGAKAVILMTHLGRPKEGEFKAEDSLAPVVSRLSEIIGRPVDLVADWKDGLEVNDGQIIMLENVRNNVGEKRNSDELGRAYASLCDVFVHDAFGTSHRAEASTHAVAKFAPVACAGVLLSAELDALSRSLNNPQKPLVAIVGGAKVSTKLTILNSLADKVDKLIVGGGIANTFLVAKGFKVGKSLYEPDLVDRAKSIIEKINARGGDIPLPTDVVVAGELAENAKATNKKIEDISESDMILDFGIDSSQTLADYLSKANTIVFNGPLGVFEFDQFANSTQKLVKAIANSNAFSIAGGGDTIAAIEKFNAKDKISYISTGGGAFLEFLEGKLLPAVEILESRSKN